MGFKARPGQVKVEYTIPGRGVLPSGHADRDRRVTVFIDADELPPRACDGCGRGTWALAGTWCRAGGEDATPGCEGVIR